MTYYDQDWLDARLSAARYVGQAVEAEFQAKRLQALSGDLFAAGKDEIARYVRSMVGAFEESAKAHRATQRKKQEEADRLDSER